MANKDDKNILQLINKFQVSGFRFQELPDIKFFTVSDRKKVNKIKKIIKIPGRHNIYNALAAYYCAKCLKIPEKTILAGISEYTGAWRRFEYKGRIFPPALPFSKGERRGDLSRKLAENIKKRGKDAIFIANFDKTADFLKKNLKSNDLVIIMGAGDVYKLSEKLKVKS